MSFILRAGARACLLLATSGWAGCSSAPARDPADAGASDALHDGALPAPDAATSDAGAHGDGGTAEGFDWQLPEGFPEPKVPEDNPMSQAKVELGRHLFYDTRLSANQTQSCASCHQQALAFTDGRPVGIGSTGEAHSRGAMSLANVAYTTTMTWANPALRTLERQALVPLFGEDPVELGLVGMEEVLLERLRAEPRYEELFAAAFPADQQPIRMDRITKAIAAFERVLISGDSPFDRFQRGETDALSDAARRGMDLFFSERAECFHCHGGFAMSDSVTHVGKVFDEIAFHNTGLYNVDGQGGYPEGNEGVYATTHERRDMGRFKAPTLRNIAVTAPYMHDGSIGTLEEVIEHYAAGGRTLEDGPYAGVGSQNPYKSELVTGFLFTDEEKADLVAFLEALTDGEFLRDPRFADPWLEGEDADSP